MRSFEGELAPVRGWTLRETRNLADYAAAARRVDADLEQLPLLVESPGTAHRELGPVAPAYRPEHWTGVVFSCDEGFSAVAEVLARGSRRPLRHGDLTEAIALSRTTPVTAVVPVDAVTPQQLARIPADAQLGLFTARDVATASALAVRTLLYGPAAGQLDDVYFDTLSDEPVLPGRLTGPAASPAGLRGTLGDGVAVLAGRGHGRDCLVHLSGGGICGRAGGPEILPTPSYEPEGTGWAPALTACQQGGGCWRDDVTPADHLNAGDVRAAFTMLDSCQTAVAGGASVRTDVSIPLTMLASHAVAVAVAVGPRCGASYAAPLFGALLRANLALGEVVQQVNGAIAADREGVGWIALFGDAGLVPDPAPVTAAERAVRPGADGSVTVPSSRAAVLVHDGAVLPVGPEGPTVVPRLDGKSCWALTEAVGRQGGTLVRVPAEVDGEWRERVRPWLDRLRGLAGAGMRVDRDILDGLHRRAVAALRARAEARHTAAAVAAVNDFGRVRTELQSLERELVQQEVEWAATTFYSFTDNWPEPWRVTAVPGAQRCPQCGDDIATRHLVVPAAGAGADLDYVTCVRCGEVSAGCPDLLVEATATAPTTVRRGEPFEVTATLTAPRSRPVHVVVGAAVVHEKRFSCELSSTRSLVLTPGERHTVTFHGGSDPARTIPDLHIVKVVVLAEGRVRCLTRSLWVRV